MTFIHTSNKLFEREIMEILLFTILIRTYYLRINQMKEVNYLYNENFRFMNRKIKEDTRRWKEFLCSWIDRSNHIKMIIPPKQR